MVIGPDGQTDEGAKLLFTVGRGTAIQNYAALEHSLCFLMAYLMGTSVQVSSIVFFRIINTRSRTKILSDLVRLKIPQYQDYWKSMFKLLRSIDETRNKIVHWTAVTKIDPPAIRLSLRPPDFWNGENATEIGVQELMVFANTCNFIQQSVNVFNLAIFQGGVPNQASWLEVFQQPVVYPPPSHHPLASKQT